MSSFTRRLIFLCASLCVLTSPLGCDSSEAPSLQTIPAPQLSVTARVSGALLGVWGEPEGERVWMVGGRVEESGEATRHIALYERPAEGGEGAQGSLRLHWSAPGAPLWWVWGDARGGVWAGGEEGAIFRLNHDEGGEGSWVQEPLEVSETLSAEAIEKAIIWGIWGDTNTGELWAVGGSYRRGGPRGLLLKRSLNAEGEPLWRRVSDPLLPTELPDDPTAGLNLFKLWGEGAEGPTWAVGEGGLALYWPQGLNGPGQRLEAPAPDLMFTVHGASAGPVVAVGGYAQASAWLWERESGERGSWAPLSLPRATPPLNGVSVGGAWAHLCGGRGSVTRLWLGGEGVWAEPAVTTSVEGATSLTLHALWSPLSAGDEPELFVVGGDLERRREGVIVTNLSTLTDVEPW